MVERDDETEVNRGIWRWLGSRAVRQDFLSKDNPATTGCRTSDCPTFLPGRLA